jgi:hypothetical protein
MERIVGAERAWLDVDCIAPAWRIKPFSSSMASVDETSGNGDQRAALHAGLDHQCAQRQATDHPVAHREQLRDRAPCRWGTQPVPNPSGNPCFSP